MTRTAALPARKRSSDAPRAGRRERNKQEKLNRILVAARALFRAKGFEGTTTQEIAEAADIGSGTLFLYAKSKEDLLVMVFKDEITDVLERTFVTLPHDKPLQEQLDQLFAGFIAYHKRDVDLSRALIKELAFLSNTARKRDVSLLMTTVYGRIEELVTAAQAGGEVREDVSGDFAARGIFAIYYHYLQSWLGGYSSLTEFKRMLKESLSIFVKGLGPTDTPEETKPASARKGSRTKKP